MRKLTLFAWLLFLTTALLQAQPHAELQKKVYPNPEGISFTTPTLSIDENRFASYEEVMAWLDVRAQDPRMTLTKIGTTTKGREVPMYCLHNDTKGRKVKVWLQGAIHGNEPAAAEALFMLTDYILRTPEGARLLDRMDVYILPMANLDGYLANKRVSGDGYDLNRDQTKFADPQSVLIKRAFMQVNPDVAVDFHEFQPNHSLTRNVRIPERFRMDGNGLLLREDILDTAYVEQIYVSPRNFLYQMNKLTNERVIADQKEDKSDTPIITIDLIEKGIPDFDVQQFLLNEHGSFDGRHMTDLELCRLIDDFYIPSLKGATGLTETIYTCSPQERTRLSASISRDLERTQNAVTDDKRTLIGQAGLSGKYVTKAQLRRCLVL